MRTTGRVVGIALLATGWITSGCGGAQPPTTANAIPSPSPILVTPSPSASQPPESPTAGPTSAPSGDPGATAEAPVAYLVADGERFAGEVGGFTFGRWTSSAPWLPASALDPVSLAAGTSVRVELDERATIAEWVARYAAAEDTVAETVIPIGRGDGTGAEFDPPPPGAWVVSVTITYGDGLGDGAYYWHLVVE